MSLTKRRIARRVGFEKCLIPNIPYSSRYIHNFNMSGNEPRSNKKQLDSYKTKNIITDQSTPKIFRNNI